MVEKADAARLLEYTVWANHRVMRAATAVDLADFKRDLGASFGGVRGTLAHMMGTEWIWLERWKGVSPSRLLDESEFGDLLILRDRWTVIEQHRADWLAGLRDDALRGPVTYRNTEGREFTAPLWELVQHAVNHSTYHRGQVAVMLRMLAVTPVSTDLLLWDRERHAKEGWRNTAARGADAD